MPSSRWSTSDACRFSLGIRDHRQIFFRCRSSPQNPEDSHKAAEPVLTWFKAGPLICEFLLAKNVLPSSVVNGEHSLVRWSLMLIVVSSRDPQWTESRYHLILRHSH